ncbi:MAG: helix-turn-helix domain-containing protein [Candidatus Cybelea sp.]
MANSSQGAQAAERTNSRVTNLASDKLAYTIAEAAAALSMGETNLRRLVKEGDIAAVHVGVRKKKILIPAAALEAWLHRESAA